MRVVPFPSILFQFSELISLPEEGSCTLASSSSVPLNEPVTPLLQPEPTCTFSSKRISKRKSSVLHLTTSGHKETNWTVRYTAHEDPLQGTTATGIKGEADSTNGLAIGPVMKECEEITTSASSTTPNLGENEGLFRQLNLLIWVDRFFFIFISILIGRTGEVWNELD